MVITKTILSYCNPSFPLSSHNARKLRAITLANKKDLPQSSNGKSHPFFQLKFSNKLAAQLGVGIFALGFVDAGYSGDWSRIEAISKETEELLKVAAFFVVPFCLFVVLSISVKQND